MTVQIKGLLFQCTTNLTTIFLEQVTDSFPHAAKNYLRLRKWPKIWANIDAMPQSINTMKAQRKSAIFSQNITNYVILHLKRQKRDI